MLNNNVSRRNFIAGMASAAAALPAAELFSPSLLAAQNELSQTLKAHAARAGLIYGSCATYGNLQKDPQYADLFAKQCGILVPESQLKWSEIRPGPDQYNFGAADFLFKFAEEHRMKFRGHTFLSHDTTPPWFDSYVNRDNAKKMLEEHITRVAGHFRGKMQSWDVVNEVIAPVEHRADGFRSATWENLLGPEHIDIAFDTCAKVDPSALRIWNESWLEEESDYGKWKRAFMLQHLKDLLKRGIPVQGIGIQSHLMADHDNIAGSDFQRFCQEVTDLGLKIIVSEMDVRDFKVPGSVDARDKIVADKYYKYLTTILKYPSVIAVITWGISDRYTWLTKNFPRPDGTPIRPLPFDENLKPVPAYSAIARAFDEAPSR